MEAHFTTSKPSTCNILLYATFWSTPFVTDWKAFCEEVSHKLTSPLLTMLLPKTYCSFRSWEIFYKAIAKWSLSFGWSRSALKAPAKCVSRTAPKTVKSKTCDALGSYNLWIPIFYPRNPKNYPEFHKGNRKGDVFSMPGVWPCSLLLPTIFDCYTPGYWSGPYSAPATPPQGSTVMVTRQPRFFPTRKNHLVKNWGFLYVFILSNKFQHSRHVLDTVSKLKECT